MTTNKAKLLHALKEYGKLCNNTINSGDCYGETHCFEENGGCSHKDFRCVNCGCFFCGCCHFYKRYICPTCDVDPKNFLEKSSNKKGGYGEA